MVTYNLIIKVDAAVASEYFQWFFEEHTHDIMDTGLFAGYDLYKIIEPYADYGESFLIRFFCDNLQDYQAYINQHSETMRNRFPKQFEGTFKISRFVAEWQGVKL